MKKRLLAGFLAAMMLVGLSAAPALAEELEDAPALHTTADNIEYLDCDANGQDWERKTCSQATVVESGTATWTDGWYVVNGDITFSSRINVNGNVHLILVNGSKLTAESGGINVAEGNSLTIYAQSTGDSMGQLSAKGGNNQAGIGGGTNSAGGTITINGGSVTAAGTIRGAGIGGGGATNNGSGGAGGNITINGGSVTATGGHSVAGIGGGNGGAGGTITINGGSVTATGGAGNNSGAGIGGGQNGADGSFSTGTNGNVFIVASSISDQSQKSGWRGVIFEGDAGQVYNDPVLASDVEIPSGKTLTIPEGKTLTIPDGVTLTNSGIITNNGSITNNGTITTAEGHRIALSSNAAIQTGSGPKLTVGVEATAAGDGSVTIPGGGSVTVQKGDLSVAVTVPSSGGTITPQQDGGIQVPSGCAVRPQSGPEITINSVNGTVGMDGSITVGSGGSVTVQGAGGSLTSLSSRLGPIPSRMCPRMRGITTQCGLSARMA